MAQDEHFRDIRKATMAKTRASCVLQKRGFKRGLGAERGTAADGK